MKRRNFLKGLAAFVAAPGILKASDLASGGWEHIATVPLRDVKVFPSEYEELGDLTLIRLARDNDSWKYLLAANGKYKQIEISSRMGITADALPAEVAYAVGRKERELLIDWYAAKYGGDWQAHYRKRMAAA